MNMPKVEKPACREMRMEEFRDGYVDAYYPGLTGYGYQAEMLTKDEGKEVMERILKNVVRIETCGNGSPILIMKDGKELFVDDTDDFPVPTSEE